MRIIQELSEAVETLIEGAGAEKKYYISGIFAQAELTNRNNRMYSKKILESAIDKYQPMIKARRAISELNHPSGPQVNPERASHLIESLTWDGNNVIGKAKVMVEMPMGKIVKGLLDEGVQLGISTRGMGSLVESNGLKLVQPDYMITAFDVVSDPSGPNCFVNGLMEDAEWVYEAYSKSWVLAENMKKVVKSISTSKLEEIQSHMFKEFLKSIK